MRRPRGVLRGDDGLVRKDRPCASGETIAFRATSADTDGAYLEIDLYLTPDGHVPGTHVHPAQEERFEILEGTMKFKLGFKTIVAGEGDVVVVPAGSRHRFVKRRGRRRPRSRDGPPALDMEDLFGTTVALAEAGRTNRKGMPKPLDLALVVERFEDEVRAPFPPALRARTA